MDAALPEEHESFRNELASVARDGRRRWIYARQPGGWFYRARTIVSWFLLGFLFLAPFITVRGEPLMLLDVLHRRFVLLGVVFRPQDFYLVVLIALAVLVTQALSTVVVGRIWCGWLCPQTIFMEMLSASSSTSSTDRPSSSSGAIVGRGRGTRYCAKA